MKVYEHKVEIHFNGKPNIAITREYNVLGSNERLFVIDDARFSTYQHKKDKGFNLYPTIEEIMVLDWSNDAYFNKIIVSILTNEPDFKKARIKLANKFEKWLYEKHGRFVQSFQSVSGVIRTIDMEAEANYEGTPQ